MAAGKRFRILTVALDDVPSHEEAKAHTGALDLMLDEEKPCALMVIVPDNPHGASQHVIEHMRDWLESRRGSIEEHCKGIAFVVNSRLLLMTWKPLLALKGRDFFGCTVRAFHKRHEAEAWLSSL